MTDLEIEALLRAGFPPRTFEALLAEPGDKGIGDLLQALASEANADGFALGDRFDIEKFPSTASEKLPDWERAFGLSRSTLALYGSDAARQSQVVARWREHGPSNPDVIAAALAAVLGYAPTILEHSRSALRVINTYAFPGLPRTIPNNSTISLDLHVADNAPCSQAGAQVRIAVSHPQVELLEFTLVGPDGTAQVWTTVDRGSVTSKLYRLYAPVFAGRPSTGVWTMFVSELGGYIGTQWEASSASGLFVEGIGRDIMTGAEGLASDIFEWAALVDESAALSTYDRSTVRSLVARWNPAHCRGFVALRQTNGDVGAVAGDPNCIAGITVCGS